MFSGLCYLHYWPGTKTFLISAVSALYRIHHQWGWKCLERTSSLSQPLTHEEWQRWQEGAPPAFRFVHPSVLSSHADRALQLSISQYISVQLSTSLMSPKLLEYGACVESCAQDTHQLVDFKAHGHVSVAGWRNSWKFQIKFEMNYK